MISEFVSTMPLFYSQIFLVTSMDLGVIHFSDLPISAASGICMVRVDDVFSFRQDISYPFDPGSEGLASLEWMQ